MFRLGEEEALSSVLNTSYGNVSDAERREYLEHLQSYTTKTMIAAMTSLLLFAVTGLIGNSLVLFVYSRRFKRTSTRVFIMAIAAFDLVSNVIVTPGEIYDMFHIWDFDNPTLCRLRLFFSAFTTVTAAIALLAVAVVRYRKVCKPFGRQITVKQSKIISIAVAGIACLFAIPTAIINGRQTRMTPRPDIHGYECTTDDSFVDTIWPLINTGLLLLLFLSCCVPLIVLYILIGLQAWKHSQMYGVASAGKPGAITTVSYSGTSGPFTKSTDESTPDTRRKKIAQENAAASGNKSDANEEHHKCSSNVTGVPLIRFCKYDDAVELGEDESSFNTTREEVLELLTKTTDVADEVTGQAETSIQQTGIVSVTSNSESYDSPSGSPKICVRTQKDVSDVLVAQYADTLVVAESLPSDQSVVGSIGLRASHDITSMYLKEEEDQRPAGQSPEPTAIECPPFGPFSPTQTVETSDWLPDSQTGQVFRAACESSQFKHDPDSDGSDESGQERTKILSAEKDHSSNTITGDPRNDGDRAKCLAFPNDNLAQMTHMSNANGKSTVGFTEAKKPYVTNGPHVNIWQRLVKKMSINKGDNSETVGLKEGRRARKAIGRTTAMLITITVVYVISLVPHLAMMFFKFTSPEEFAKLDIAGLSMYNLFLRFYFLNSAANAIIYSICDKNFRKNCLELIQCNFGRRR